MERLYCSSSSSFHIKPTRPTFFYPRAPPSSSPSLPSSNSLHFTQSATIAPTRVNRSSDEIPSPTNPPSHPVRTTTTVRSDILATHLQLNPRRGRLHFRRTLTTKPSPPSIHIPTNSPDRHLKPSLMRRTSLFRLNRLWRANNMHQNDNRQRHHLGRHKRIPSALLLQDG